MAYAAHSDWMLDHSSAHHVTPPVDAHHAEPTLDTSHADTSDSVASVLKTLWHHTDLMSGGAGSGSTTPSTSTAAQPLLAISQTALTVNAGGSIALPITVTPANAHDPAQVTITGLTNYESLTDHLDHKVFTGSSVTLSAAEVNSGLSLASAYTGTGHPVNTLSVTASELSGGHVLTTAAQNIVVTDPPVGGPNAAPVVTSANQTVQSGHSVNLSQVFSAKDSDGDTITQYEVWFGNGVDPTHGTLSVNGTPVANPHFTVSTLSGLTYAGTSTAASDVVWVRANDGTQFGNWTMATMTDPGAGPNAAPVISATDQSIASGQSITLTQAFSANDSDGDAITQYEVWFGNGVDPTHGTLSLNGTPVSNPHFTVSTLTGLTYAGSPAGNDVIWVRASDGAQFGTWKMATMTDPPASGSGGSGNPLMLTVSGDMYQGDPQFQVFVDGHQAGGTYSVTAHHSQGQTQTIQVAGTFDPTVAHQVQVKFINDAWDGTAFTDGHDMNLYVESISLNGVTLNGAQGTNAANNGAVHSATASEAVMSIDGALTFNVAADPPATASGSGTGTGTGAVTSASTGGSTGTVGTGTVGTGAGAPSTASGYYVSPNGSDSNSGLDAAHPFATLAHAQQAMEHSSIKTTYVEGGTYHLTQTLSFTAADNGETWQYYAPNGVNSAVLDGGGTGVIGSNTGLYTMVSINGVSNLTINGLKFQNFDASAISTPGANARNDHLVIENCDIGHDSYGSQWGLGAIEIGNSTNVTIANNYVHDVHWDGIMLLAYNPGETIDGSVIKGNVVLNAANNPASADAGGIYVSMYGTGVNGGHVTVENNYVANYGSSVMQARAVYLDDNASNVTVTGNVLGAPRTTLNSSNDIAVSAVFVHNGANNHITDNIIDLGSSGNASTVIWGYDTGSLNGMAGNTFTNNVVVSSYTGTESVRPDGNTRSTTFFEGSRAGLVSSDFTIQHNLYYNYAGGQVSSGGTVSSDTSPLVANPVLSGWNYQLASNSPAYTSSVGFTPIAGGWGPAGFVIPQAGATPSTLV